MLSTYFIRAEIEIIRSRILIFSRAGSPTLLSVGGCGVVSETGAANMSDDLNFVFEEFHIGRISRGHTLTSQKKSERVSCLITESLEGTPAEISSTRRAKRSICLITRMLRIPSFFAMRTKARQKLRRLSGAQ